MIRAGRVRRWLTGVGSGVLIVMCATCAVLYWTVSTDVGTRFAVETLLDWYNGMIPGQIEAVTSGTFMNGVRFNEIICRDRRGRVLVRVDRLQVTPTLNRLLSKEVHVAAGLARGGMVDVRWVDDRSPFSDLAPNAIDSSLEDSSPYRLSMPFRLSVSDLSVQDVQVVIPGPAPLVVERLDLNGAWKGDVARFDITDLKGEYAPVGSVEKTHAVARLVDGEQWRIEDAVFKTNLGKLSSSSVFFNINTLSGKGNMQFEPAPDRLSSIALLPKNAPVSARVSVAIDKVETLSFEGRLLSNEVKAKLNARLGLTETMPFTGRYTIQQIDLKKWGAPINTSLNLRGEVDGHLAGDAGPIASMTLTCPDCHLSGFGSISLSGTGHYDPTKGVDTELTLTSKSSRLEVIGSWNNHIVDSRAQLHLADLSVLSSIELPLIKGMLDADAHCTGTLTSPSCRIAGNSAGVQVNGVKLKGIKTDADLKYISKKGVVLNAHTEIDGLNYERLSAKKATVDIQSIDTGYKIEVSTRQNQKNHATLLGSVSTQKGVTVFIKKMESTLRGLPFHLEQPVEVRVENEGVRIGKQAIVLSIGDGRLIAHGGISARRFSNVRIDAENLRLGWLSKVVNKPAITGRVSAHIFADGPWSHPHLKIDATAQGVSIDKTPRRNGSIALSVEPSRTVLKASVKKWNDTVLAEVEGTIASAVNLRRLTSLWPLKQAARFTWQVNGLKETDVSPFYSLPKGVRFHVDGQGALAFSQMSNFQLSGTLDGRFGVPGIGFSKIHSDFQFIPKKQTMTLSADHILGMPMEGTFEAAISIPQLLKGNLLMLPSHARLAHGKAVVDVKGAFENQNGSLDLTWEQVDLTKLQSVWPTWAADGVVNGEGHAVIRNGTSSFEYRIDAKKLKLDAYHVGGVQLKGGYESEHLTADVLVSQRSNTVFDASMKIPIQLNLTEGRMNWQRGKTHRLAFHVADVDWARIHPRFAKKPFPVLAVESSGTFEGALNRLGGYAEIHTTLTHRGFGKVPMHVRLEMEQGEGKLTLNATHNGVTVLGGQVAVPLPVLSLLEQKKKIAKLPISARLDFQDIDLAWFNALGLDSIYDLSGALVANLTLDGTLGQPDIRGSLSITDGEMLVGTLTDPFTDIRASLKFKNRTWQLQHFSMKSAEGGLSAAANGVLRPHAVAVNVRAKSRKFRIAMAGMPAFTLDMDAGARMRLSKQKLDVDLQLKQSSINHLGSTGISGVRAVPKNENVRIIDPKVKSEKKPAAAVSLPMYIRVRTDEPLRVHGPSLDTAWRVDIDTKILNHSSEIQGEALIDKGAFYLFANDFTIEKAKAYFTEKEGMDPHISLLATSVLPSAKVFLKMDGTIMHPRLKVYSEPAMSEEAIFAMLVSGSDDESVQGSGAVSSVVQMKYPIVTHLLYNRFNFDRVAVGSNATGTGTQVKLGQRISDRLFLYTAFSLSSQKKENDFEVIFEYSITDRLTMETIAGNKRSGTELNLRIPVGLEKPKRRRRFRLKE